MAGPISNRISGKDTLVDKLGYWPEFCDAKILELNFCVYGLDTSIVMLLHYIDSDRKLDARVKLILHGISDLEFNELRIENVVDHIDLNELKHGIEFRIEACAGFYGGCSCQSAVVQLVSLKTYLVE